MLRSNLNIKLILISNVQSYKDISYEQFLKCKRPVIEIKENADDELHKAFSSLKYNKLSG